MRKFKPHFILWATLTFALGIGLVFAMDLSRVSAHLWRKVSHAKVTYKGQASPHSVVYRGANDRLLVILDEGSHQSYHVVFPDLRNVGVPNDSNFFFFPGYAYSKDADPPCMMMNPAKGERWAQLLSSENSVEFNGDLEGRVHVDW